MSINVIKSDDIDVMKYKCGRGWDFLVCWMSHCFESDLEYFTVVLRKSWCSHQPKRQDEMITSYSLLPVIAFFFLSSATVFRSRLGSTVPFSKIGIGSIVESLVFSHHNRLCRCPRHDPQELTLLLFTCVGNANSLSATPLTCSVFVLGFQPSIVHDPFLHNTCHFFLTSWPFPPPRSNRPSLPQPMPNLSHQFVSPSPSLQWNMGKKTLHIAINK